MKVESLAIASLRPDPRNPRRHSPRNLEAIRNSLATFGQQKPIVVGKDNVILAGNGTVEAARQLGWTRVDAVRSDLAEAAAEGFRVADNRTAELAEWDPGVLLSMDVDLNALGFSEADAAELAEMAELAGEAQAGGQAADPARGGRADGLKAKRPTIRVVLAFEDLRQFEAAILATGKMNRSEAVMELCRAYGRSTGQLDGPSQGDAAPPGDGGDPRRAAPAKRRAGDPGNARWPRQAV
jgi:ParB-like chromosome segregation protein Spo0J